jgi:protein-tyrosine phosphatase
VIDIHCHALPGADGPASDAGGVELLAALAAQGVDTVAVTPYVPENAPAELPAQIRDSVAALRRSAGDTKIPAVIAGAEVDLGWALAAPPEALRQATFGGMGKSLLVNVPEHDTPRDFDDLLLNLMVRGYGIVMAHPERGPSYQQAPERLGRLVAAGILVQVDAASLLGDAPPAAARLATVLLEESYAHIIASNAGGAEGRPVRLAEAVALAEEMIGPRARWMAREAPAAVLAGAPLRDAPDSKPARRGLFGRRR